MFYEMFKQNEEMFGGIIGASIFNLLVLGGIFWDNETISSFLKGVGVWALETIGIFILAFLYILLRAGVRIASRKIRCFINERRNKND